MSEENKVMKPIWYFVGWVLSIIGCLVSLAGIYGLLFPGPSYSVLSELHPNLWWGIVMVVVGIIFIHKNKNKIIH